jgi:hypothetical protein
MGKRTGSIMDYEAFSRRQPSELRREGRHRVFADLERRAGRLPRAAHYKEHGRDEVTVWCSNDCLGMGRHPEVLKAMHAAIERCGAGAGGSDGAGRPPPSEEQRRRTPSADIEHPVGALATIRSELDLRRAA